VSRNAPQRHRILAALFTTLAALGAWAGSGAPAGPPPAPPSRVVVVRGDKATEAFVPNVERVRTLVRAGITRLTGKKNPADAWRSLVSPGDRIGIKVHSAPGPNSGTRLAVVEAVVEGLLAAKLPASNIVVWDRDLDDLRRAGYTNLTARHGIRVAGALQAGWDATNYYEAAILGQLIWSDLEFGKQHEGAGRRSFVSHLVSTGMTRLITITPLLNHNTAGVCGHLYSLAAGSVDNTLRFEASPARLATAVPEIYALPSLSDRAVLHITDALICQYEGEERTLLHYAVALNELRFSKDPVALDVLSLRELDRQRQAAGIVTSRHLAVTNRMELFQNAALLELGVADPDAIKMETDFAR
jgi:hypothetical protein